MVLTMENVMKLGRLNECTIVAGSNGLNRVVKHITIIEVPEVAQWLKGNELLLTTLYSIRNDEQAQVSLIQELNTSGVSGLAIKLSQMDEIPESIIKSANDLDFPIIKIPIEIKYLDILTPVMNRLVNDKVILQEDVYQATSLLEEALHENKGLDIFAENLQAIVKNPITIESEILNIDINFGKNLESLKKEDRFELSLIKRPLKFERKIDGKVFTTIVAPVIIEQNYYGNITCWLNDTTDFSMDMAVLERAATLLTVEFLKMKARNDIELQYENDFVKELIFSENIKKRSVIERANGFKITANTNTVCLIFNAEHISNNDFDEGEFNKNKVYKGIKNLNPSSIMGQISNNFVLIYSRNNTEKLNESELTNYYNTIKKIFGESFEVFMGAGRIEKGVQGIQDSFQQALKAMSLGRSISKGDDEHIYRYDNLGVYILLDKLYGTTELEGFYSDILKNLLNHDGGLDLIETLRIYFYNNESLKVSSEKLFIHVNTLKYRLKKIQELTKQNINTTEGKMNLYLTLKIYNMKSVD